MSEKCEIKVDKKEVKNTISDIEKSDYYQRISEQVKKIRSGQVNEAFKGNAEKWKEMFQNAALAEHDSAILAIMREEYVKYSDYIEQIQKFIGFHKLNIQKSLSKVEIKPKKEN